MEGDVNTHYTIVADVSHLAVTSGVRLTAQLMVSGRVTFRPVRAVQPGAFGGSLEYNAALRCCDCLDRAAAIEAVQFLRAKREPTFYQGFGEPLLRSVLRGGIAYAGGLCDLRR